MIDIVHFFSSKLASSFQLVPSGAISLIYSYASSYGACSPVVGQDHFIHQASRPHTTTHYSRQDSSGRVISPSQRPLSDNTQHSQQTNIHAPGGIRTHNPS